MKELMIGIVEIGWFLSDTIKKTLYKFSKTYRQYTWEKQKIRRIGV